MVHGLGVVTIAVFGVVGRTGVRGEPLASLRHRLSELQPDFEAPVSGGLLRDSGPGTATGQLSIKGGGSPSVLEPYTRAAFDSATAIANIFSDVYHIAFIPLLALTLILAWLTRPRASEELPRGFATFQWTYLLVWFMAVAADWLQGPYVYALYASYGFTTMEIAQLFVGGFGASMLFGTFVGALADILGRKRCAMLYCAFYAISCITKHWNHFGILMFGRVTGGIATSLLFSVFECWMVAEHCQRHRFSPALLRHMFGLMYFGNFAVAITAGLVSQVAADAFPLEHVGGTAGFSWGGYTAPFDAAIVMLAAAFVPICVLWDENYGNSLEQVTLLASLGSACRTALFDWRVCLLGISVTAYEACMYAFIFNWTPALASGSSPPRHGLIFSLFMMACMCGSSVFSIVSTMVSPSKIILPTFVLATVAMGTASFCLGSEVHLHVVFLTFLVFEFSVGVYFPAIGHLKSQLVPEANRAGIYNLYRVPLNGVVVALLLCEMQLATSFGICCALLTVAVVALAPLMAFPGPAAQWGKL